MSDLDKSHNPTEYATMTKNVPTYTVVNQQGTVLERHLTPEEAMGAILSADSHNWQIRPAADGQGYILWTDTFSRASGISGAMTETTIYSLEDDEPTATLDIAHKVIARGGRGGQAILDADYDRAMRDDFKEELKDCYARIAQLEAREKDLTLEGLGLIGRIEMTRDALAGTDAGSLPNDYPLERMAADRMARIAQLEAEGDKARARGDRMRMALEWIDHQRYTGRSTINPANGYDRAVALNTKLLAVMDVARGTLAQQKPNE